jgi:hypothetical protein
MKLWFRIAAKGFLLIGGCLGSKWPIVPWVTLHFASCFVPAGKSSIVSDYLEDYLEELECATIESSFLRRIPGMKMTCVLRKADTPTFSVAGRILLVVYQSTKRQNFFSLHRLPLLVQFNLLLFQNPSMFLSHRIVIFEHHHTRSWIATI